MHAHPARGHVALVVLIGTIWGLNWPIVKMALVEFGPWTMRALSLAGASLLLMLISTVQRHSLRVAPSQWWRIAAPGLSGIAGVNILNAFAQMNMSTGRTAIITFSMPIWTTLLAVVFLDEPLDRRKIIGLALGAGGLIVLALPVIHHGTATLGVSLAFLSALAWASSLVCMKRFPIAAPPIVAATWQVTCGAVFLIAGMLLFEHVPPTFNGVTPGVLGLVYNAILAQGVATFLWFQVVVRTPAGVAAIGTLMVPAIGMIGAIFLLGEVPLVTDWIGLALVLAASASVLIPPVRPARFERDAAAVPTHGCDQGISRSDGVV
ncbi:DMT family transporter [Chelatococcus reniformis]|uniref:EamA domain-containing protein n=1 Tax=Chelatococcus reniformis TaxID=1494448 RepID=A0A916XL94_9HYPH|nr:DMT family transporter [Chelatococcus reniformis]GGC83593.1 hypothetical protein GCM10010994_46840 [Chelatococcus reniformis]